MTHEQQLERRKQIRDIAEKIAELDVEKLVRSDLPLNFKEWRHEFERIIRFNRDLAEADLSVLPPRFLEPFYNNAGRVLEAFGKILEYKFSEGEPSARRDLMSRLHDQFTNQYDNSIIHLTYARTHGGPLTAEIADAKRIATDATNALTGVTAEQGRLKTEGDKLLAALSTAVQESGVSREAQHFAGKAREFKIASRIWIGLAILAGALVFLVIGYLLDPDRPIQNVPWLMESFPFVGPRIPRDAGEIAEHVLARVAILTLFSTALWFCLKNYSAAQHNYIVNDHRAVSLETFQAFASGAPPDVRAAVLLQAAAAAFSAQSSGYLKGESGETLHSANALDLVRSLATKE